MNRQPIEQAHDADMRQNVAALNRAACRAREIAVQTGTQLVISRDGVVLTLEPGRMLPNAPAGQTLKQK